MTDEHSNRPGDHDTLIASSNAHGMYLWDCQDGDPSKGDHVAKWWPTTRCDDEAALRSAYDADEGKWYT